MSDQDDIMKRRPDRHSHRPWPRTVRAAAATIAGVGLAVPVAAFGSDRSTKTERALAYSRCMRSHGVPNYSDPASGGALPKISQQELGAPQFRAAERACQRLLPPGTNDQFPPGEVQQLLIGMLRFSRCMRSHGVPNFPDPQTDALGRPEFPLSRVSGTDRNYWHSPRIARSADECQHLLPAALGGIPVG